MKNRVLPLTLTILLGVAVVLLILTVSIGLPIYLRFFYYMQINPLNLPENSGYDYATIKHAYDCVLDYLTLPNREFSAGVFKFTEEGASHFADCKVLFNLNAIVLIISMVTVITLFILEKLKIIKTLRPFNMNVCFISATVVLALFAIIAIVVAIDFNSAFIVFHKIFFAGKDNWSFNPYQDQIINVLPQEFFMACAILIVSGIILISVGILTFQLIKRRKNRKNKEIL